MSTEEQTVIADPHGLLASGERLATVAALADEHKLSRVLVRRMLGAYYSAVRYVDARPHRRYSAFDFAALVLRLRPQIAERAKRIAETEARQAENGRQRREREAKALAEKATKAATKKKTKASGPPPAPPPPTPRLPAHAMGTVRRGPSMPEVTVIRRAAR